ncbi:hypothetical protein MNBD_PLANCTO03-1734, partial [hydrothermal vent metagenome]
ETIDPLQTQRYRVTQPRATIYLEDGRVVHITADGGTLVMPDRAKAPETGTLKGNVVVRHFDALPSGLQPDPERDEPSFVWRGTSLTFDATLGEASTNEPFVLTSATFRFEAADAKLLINQTLERLERFTVRKGGTLISFAEPQKTEKKDTTTQPETRPSTPALAQQTNTPREPAPTEPLAPSPPHEPVITFYQGVMRDGIILERGGQRIESDRLDLFARTIDNKLPEGAIPSLAVAKPETPPDRAGETPAPLEQQNKDQADETPAPLEETPPARDDATLQWTGVLEVRPLSAEPPELEENHLAARFTAEQSGVVSFSDTLSQASGQAAVVEYFMTTQRLILTGPSQERSVFITSPTIGRATMGRFELPLATGNALVPGPFSVIAADGISRVDAREQTNLIFAVRDGRLTGELLEVMCQGSARAADADASIEADFLHAYFQQDETGDSQLRRLIARDGVRLADGEGAGGTCDTLEVTFDPNAQEPTPATVDALGNVNFRDQTAKIEADHLFVNLRETENGSIEVAKAWADGDITFRQLTDQIEITGDRLFVDADAEYIEVAYEGEDQETLARIVRGATIITGKLVRLNGSLGTATVQGPGSFAHRAGTGNEASSVLATWTEGMAFDDATGQLECLGNVEAIHEPDPLTRDTITAALVRVQLDPASETTAPLLATGETPDPLDATGETIAPRTDNDRAIRTVYAAGEAYFGVGDTLAVIESSRFAPGVAPPVLPTEKLESQDSLTSESGPEKRPERALERAFRLSGVEILSDNQAGTLDVPGRGRLFVADLRPIPEGEEASADRGAALFDWQGSLHADRARGTAEILEGVQMNHTRMSDAAKTFLECGRLRISFAPGEDDTPENIFGGLRSAIADTDVYLRTDTRELTADLLEYTPETGIARALAEGFNSVRILDRTTGSPTSASAIIWNLTTDRVDIVDPSTITIAR